MGTAPAADYLLQRFASSKDPAEKERVFSAIVNVQRPEARSAFEYAALGNKTAVAEATRVAAIQALGNYPDDATAQVLERLTQEKNAAIRTAAQAALGKVRKGLTP